MHKTQINLSSSIISLIIFFVGSATMPGIFEAASAQNSITNTKTSEAKIAKVTDAKLVSPHQKSNAVTSSITTSQQFLKPDEIRLDTNEDQLAANHDFSYFAPGHFGDKTQYMGKLSDEFGGAYALHCRSRKTFCIEVKYQNSGLVRSSALKVMNRLLPLDAGKIIEHDDDDLVKHDTPQPAEFFYYQNGPRTELLFAKNSITHVIQINIWTKNG